MQIILGSSSPRRKEILNHFSLPFVQANPKFDESSLPFLGDPQAHALTLAIEKAKSLIPLFPDQPILTADTLVFREGKLFHQPKTASDAFHCLSELVGRWHTVWTAVALAHQGQIHTRTEKTEVLLRPLNAVQIMHYQKQVGAFDKAGGYAIQGAGELIIERIEGSYSCAKGLPIGSLIELFKEIGVDLWSCDFS